MAVNTLTAGLGGLGYNPFMTNDYVNNVALNDMYNSSGCAYQMPMMSMNGSVFGGGMGLGTMPSFTGGTYDQDAYYKYMDKNQDYMINYEVNQQEKMRNADMRLNSSTEVLQLSGKILHEKIMQNEQEQIQKAYQDYCERVKDLYGQCHAEQVLGRADKLYQMQFGTSITDDLRKNGTGSFTQEFLQTLPFAYANNKTAEENISQITGQDVGRKEHDKKIAGNLLGGATIGSIAGLILPRLIKMRGLPVIGMIAGAIAGYLY